MNSFLPEFYKAKFKYSKNAKHFVKEFHGTGRQLYQSMQQIDVIEKQIDSLMNIDNPAAAGVVLDSDYSLVPSDTIRITNNIQKTKQITTNLSSISNDVTVMNDKLFSSSGVLRHGEEATHKALEQQIGKINFLKTRVKDIHGNLSKLKEKCSSMFIVSYARPMSNKRKQKQNKRKAKKAEEVRREANCQRVVEIIAPQHQVNDSSEPISALLLHFEGISGLSKAHKPYVQLAFDKGLFTKESQDVIKQYLCFSLDDDDDDDDDDDAAAAADVDVDVDGIEILTISYFISLPIEDILRPVLGPVYTITLRITVRYVIVTA